MSADRLADLAAPAVRAAAKAYLTSHNAAAFERAMQRALATAHTAAYLRGVAERSAAGRVREWLGRLVGDRALSKDDRTALRTALAEQFKYLGGFVEQLGGMSEAQVAARAALYLGAVRATYYGARFPGLTSYPGDGSTACRTNCRCRLESRENGIWWVLGTSEHCDDCRERASGSPYEATA